MRKTSHVTPFLCIFTISGCKPENITLVLYWFLLHNIFALCLTGILQNTSSSVNMLGSTTFPLWERERGRKKNIPITGSLWCIPAIFRIVCNSVIFNNAGAEECQGWSLPFNKQKRKTPNRNITVYVQKTQQTGRKQCCAAVPGVEGGCCGRLVGRETGPTSVCANTFSLPTCSIQQLDQSPRASNYDAPLSFLERLARVGICCQECKHPKNLSKRKLHHQTLHIAVAFEFDIVSRLFHLVQFRDQTNLFDCRSSRTTPIIWTADWTSIFTHSANITLQKKRDSFCDWGWLRNFCTANKPAVIVVRNGHHITNINSKAWKA